MRGDQQFNARLDSIASWKDLGYKRPCLPQVARRERSKRTEQRDKRKDGRRGEEEKRE